MVPFSRTNYLFKQGREFAISRAIFPDGKRRDLLWYGRPIGMTSPEGIVVQYADRDTCRLPDLVSGQGFVIVSGLHPAATPLILNALGMITGGH